MANIYENPSYRANIGYSGFPMGQLTKFSSTVGELLPVYYDFLQAGDKVTIQTELKTRTMNLEAAAMCSIDEHIDWFYVPLEQIYTPFGSWFYQINDIKSSLIDPSLVSYQIPYFSIAKFFAGLQEVVKVSAETTGVADDFGVVNSQLRLLEMLGIDSDYLYGSVNAGEPVVIPFMPWFACAYQKIYYDRFCLKDRERCNPKYWSLDKYYSNPEIPAADFKNFTKLHYRPYERDFFMNSYVSPVFSSGDISSLREDTQNLGLEQSLAQWLVSGVGNNFVTATPDGTPSQDNQGTHIELDSLSLSGTTSNQFSQISSYLRKFVNPTSIRSMFAVQKLLEVTRRAGKHVDAQQLAHFGVKLPVGVSGEVINVGSSVSTINIGDVIATSTTADSVLGQVGGKGYGYGKSSKMKFEAPTHGILMAIYSAVPKPDYKQGFDRLHTYLTLESFPRPEFDNLGMQPLFSYQGKVVPEETQDEAFVFDDWQYRWAELKSKPNRVCGALARTLSYWSTQRYYDTTQSNLLRYLVSPFALNSIMLVNYTNNTSNLGYEDVFARDPLFHELWCDVKKASKMSTYGLENL